MPRTKLKRTPKSWKERELVGLQKELKGTTKWLHVLAKRLADNKDDRWAQGMFRHYSDRSVALRVKIDQLTQK